MSGTTNPGEIPADGIHQRNRRCKQILLPTEPEHLQIAELTIKFTVYTPIAIKEGTAILLTIQCKPPIGIV